jgi:hypothetical protein
LKTPFQYYSEPFGKSLNRVGIKYASKTTRPA